ncbi:RED-like protein, putative [Plasmodium gallinaceum]|uniref:RED-like protein, putative n=1 Tax=Plasmodium gallinaceum TaxID=5849 RepID=A0A1J1GY92_PLAGA|nr:RED-like protein, putative [Plasmodium gallinaceum]CRG97456.1 RED-like protein, putative [Plasmodium gallinaceum]
MSNELTNNDFRLIFDKYEKEKKEKEIKLLLKEEKKLKRKQKYLVKKKKNEEKSEQKYRDRAEERRKGIIKDIKDSTVLYNNVNNTIDESKYMGGDIEHTHLVKGLDFLLLNKIRNKLINKISLEKEKVKSNKIKYPNKIPEFLNNESKYIYKYFFLYEHPHHINFKKKIENIYNNIMNNMKFKNFNKNIHYFNYKYNVDMNVDKNDIPIKYIYNVDNIKTNYTYYIKDSFLNEIGICFKWHMENKKKKKNERLSKRPLTGFLKEEQICDEYIDIFKNDNENFNKNINKIENNNSIMNNNYDYNNINKVKDVSIHINDDEVKNKDDINKENLSEITINNTEKNINLFSSENNYKTNNQNLNEKKNSLNKNVFSDTYEECYPGYNKYIF